MSETRHGSPLFYQLLQDMADIHDKKSHDYASNDNPYGNYHFAGQVSSLFAHSHKDAGFVGRIAEKMYRLANLESSYKIPSNESISDTENDICVITLLWMADRKQRRFDAGPKEQALGGNVRKDNHYDPEEVQRRSREAMTKILVEIGFVVPQSILELDAYLHRMASDIRASTLEGTRTTKPNY